MPVLVERIDTSRMVHGEGVAVSFSAVIKEDSKEAAVMYKPPTGREPILSVKFDEKNKREARIYVAKENRYLPVWNSDERLQIATSDENEDDFAQQRIATLTPTSRTHVIPIKRQGEKTGAWVQFRLIDPEES